jgi:hypothetical protein
LVELTSELRDRGVELREVRTGSGSLEDVFLKVTGNNGER